MLQLAHSTLEKKVGLKDCIAFIDGTDWNHEKYTVRTGTSYERWNSNSKE